MEGLDILSSLLPMLGSTVGSVVGGPAGGAIGGALGGLGSTGIGAIQNANAPPTTTRTSQPAAPGGAPGLQLASPPPEQAVPGGLGLTGPSAIQSPPQGVQAPNLSPSAPLPETMDIDRSRRIELLQELLKDLRNG